MNHRALDFRAATLDRAARTVEAIASTGAAVRRRDASGEFDEVLSLDPAHVDLSGLVGAPVLDTHRQASRKDVLGTVTAARLADGVLVVTLKITTRADGDDVLDDIENGILRGVSLGYRVARWRDERAEDGTRRLVAVRWAPVELSLVPIPADPGATIRSASMPTEDDDERSRADTTDEVRALAQIASVSAPWAGADEGADDTDTPPDPAAQRAAVLDEMRRRSAAPIRAAVVYDHDDPAVRSARIGEALFARANPSHDLSAPARQFAGMTMVDVGRDILRRAGVSVTGLSPATLITRALHTTSDFSAILGDAVNRSLRAAYEGAPAGIKTVARATTARDFRLKRRINLSAAPFPEKVNENGEFTSGTMHEAEETYKIDTFGRIIGISRQAIINDDIGAFAEVPARIGRACADFEAQHLVDLLVQGDGNGPVMSDGKRMLHNDHGNRPIYVEGTPTEAFAGALAAARLALRRQTGLQGEVLGLEARYLLLPPEKETQVDYWLPKDPYLWAFRSNPFANLEPVIESRLPVGAPLYIVADPARFDGLEYAYLDGAPGPQIESRNGFEVDGVQIKVRLDFGAGFVDWRGWCRPVGVPPLPDPET